MSQMPFDVIPDEEASPSSPIQTTATQCINNSLLMTMEYAHHALEFAKSSPERKIIAVSLLVLIVYCMTRLIKRLHAL